MKRSLPAILLLCGACDVSEPEDVRGVEPGEATEADPLDDTSSNTYACADGPAFPGQWVGTVDPDRVTTTPYDFDAGIADAIAAMDRGSFPVEITDAVVANYTERDGEIDTLWIQDGSAGLMTYNVSTGLRSDEISPGDTVSFTISDGTIYFGLPEITGISGDITVTGSQDVYLVDGTAEVVTTETHLSQNILAYGELTADEGSCGSARCFTFSYGENAHTIRVSEGLNFKVGDCIELAMPLGIYFEEEQYSVDNNDWVSVY